MSHLGKKLRAVAKSKAQARVGKAIRARKAYLPELADAHHAMKKMRVREDGGKVEGAKATVRADQKPRTKKADGGSLGENIINALPLRYRRRITPQDAEVLANAAVGSVAPTPMIGGPAMGMATRARGRPPVEPMAEPMGNRPMPPSGRVMDAEEAMARRAPPMSPATAALTLGTAAALSGMGGGDDAGSFISSRGERRSNPNMVVTAPRRPAAVRTSDDMTDRLNAMSLAQSRNGPPSADELPRNDREQQAALNMMQRRVEIENNPTTGGVSVPFDDSLLRKRGGAVKKKPFQKVQKSGNSAGNRSR